MDCPNCGVGVDIPENAYTLRCRHCHSAHLLMGEGRPLRFYVPLSVSTEEAQAQVRKVLPQEPAPKNATAIYIPYWRLHGTMFHWDSKSRRLRAKALDRSRPAGNFGMGLPSLGARLIRVKQRPYDRDTLLRTGKILNPLMHAEAAEKKLCDGAYHAFREHDLYNELEHGTIIRRKMSLIWYPYWLLWAGTKRIVVDGACPGVVGPPGRIPESGTPLRIHTDIPSLLPARCPQCGGDFKIEGFESIYYCNYCQASWRPEGRRLQEQKFNLVYGGSMDVSQNHLPLWRLKIEIKGARTHLRDQQAFRSLIPSWSYTKVQADPKKPFYVYVPAWGNRHTPRMSAVARRWTRQQPTIHYVDSEFKQVFRTIYGPQEARELAFITLLGVVHKSLPHVLFESKLRILRSELMLLPCRKGSPEWIDSVCGTAIPYTEMAERTFQ